MNRHQLEKIREQRTIEATRKNLVGKHGKLGAIAMILGTPIMAHTGNEINYMDDPYALHDPDEMPMFRDDPYALPIGWIWDGLREGIHLEIKVDDFKNEVVCYYKGYMVYREEAGLLEAYAPKHPIAGEWEHYIDLLYDRARKVKIHNIKVEEKIEEKKNSSLARRILDALRLRWGD